MASRGSSAGRSADAAAGSTVVSRCFVSVSPLFLRYSLVPRNRDPTPNSEGFDSLVSRSLALAPWVLQSTSLDSRWLHSRAGAFGVVRPATPLPSHEFETPSLPALNRSYPRRCGQSGLGPFYVAHPIRSIRRLRFDLAKQSEKLPLKEKP